MLSRSARALQLPEVAAEYLNSIPAEPTSVIESLDKWKEKVLVMLDLGLHDASVLTELDHLQLDSLSEMQRSALFYLKGLYCAKEKRFDDAMGFLMRAVKDDMKNEGVGLLERTALPAVEGTRRRERREAVSERVRAAVGGQSRDDESHESLRAHRVHVV